MGYLLKNKLKVVPFFVFFALFLCACGQKQEAKSEEVPQTKEKKKFEMYERSEMAALMRQMLHQNEQLRERILKNEDLGEFPASFERILKANMTDKQQRDDFFNLHAQSFLDAQKSIYEDTNNAKELFNQAIGNCVACHKVKCTGPIPTIEKLYLN